MCPPWPETALAIVVCCWYCNYSVDIEKKKEKKKKGKKERKGKFNFVKCHNPISAILCLHYFAFTASALRVI